MKCYSMVRIDGLDIGMIVFQQKKQTELLRL